MAEQFYRYDDPSGKTRNIKITHEDVNGNVTTENRKIKDTTLFSSSDPDIAANVALGRPIYKTKDGLYTANEFLTAPSVTIDKKTGDIRVNAPNSVMKEDWFKEQFSDNKQLKQLSQMYKMNPDYSVETTDENGKTVYQKVDELVNEYDKGLKKAVEDLQKLHSERDRVLLPVYGNKVDKMSTNDLVTALTPTYNVGDFKVSGSAVISIPDFMLNHPVWGPMIKKLTSFDEKNGTVVRDDFMKNLWNRNKNPELTAERIQELYQNLGTSLAYSGWDNVVEDDYERHGSNQAAREIAFRNFIAGQDPEADFLLKAGDVVTSVVGGIGMGLADVSMGIMNTLESVNNFLTPGDELDSHMAKDTAIAWDDWKEYNADQLQLISDASATITGVSELITGLAANIALGGAAAKVVGGAATGIVGTFVNKAQLAQTSSLGQLIVGFASALDGFGEAGKTIKSAIGAQKVFAAGGALAGSAVDIMTQAVVDAALTDPVLFRKAIDGDGGEEAYNYLNEQFAWNVGGFAAGIGIGKLAMEGANTKVGRAINAKWAQNSAKLKTIGYNISDGIKAKIARRSLEDVVAQQDDIAKAATKTEKEMYKIQSVRTAEQLDTLKAETKAFAKADINVFDGLKINEDGLAEAEKYITNIKALQNAIDMENRSLRLFVEGYDDIKINPEMAGLNKAMYNDVMEMKRYQNEMVTRTGKAFTRMQGSVFTQEAANYIGASIEVKYMEAVIASPENFAEGTVKSAMKNIDSYRDAIAAYTKEFSPELKAALDVYIEDGKKWYASMNRYRASKGLSNAQDLEDLLQSKMFENGDYMRVQRKIDRRYTETILEDGTKHTNINIEFQHLEFDDMSDFMAPDTVQSLYKLNTANAERNLGVLKTRLSVKSAMKDTIVSGEDTQLSKGFRAKTDFNKAADEYAKKFTADNTLFDASSIKSKYSDVVARAKKEAKLTADIKKTEAGIEKTATKTYRINDADRVMAANTLAPTDVKDMLTSSGKSQTGSILQDGLDQFVDDPAGFAEWYKGLPDESKNTINKVRKDYNDLVGPLPKTFDADEAEAAMKRISRGNLETLIGVDPNLEDTINLQVLRNDKDLLKSEKIAQMAQENKRIDDNFIRRNVLETQRKELVKVVGERGADEFVDDIVEFADSSIDNYITAMKTDPKTQKYVKTIAEATGDSEDDVLRYLALTSLERNQGEINKQIKAAFGSADKEMVYISKQVENAFDSMLTNYVDNVMMQMSDSKLVSGKLFDRIKAINDQITSATKQASDPFSNIIAATDTQGRKVFMQVDPVIARLYKTNVGHLQKPTTAWDNFNKLLSKTFRLGTTGVNLSSTMRQWFRDSGNAFSMGGAFRKIQSCSDELIEDWGERIVKQLSEYDYKQLATRAEELGTDIKRLAVERELRMGEVIAGQTTEVTLYKESLTKAKRLQENIQGAKKTVDDIMNGMRENYLRNRVYVNNLTQAMRNGKTLDEARIIAEFAMNNATTNFSRKLVHLQRMADSAPYLSAAINGTKSFWRMATLDPIGVVTRIMAGFVIPQMYLTASSLADENNRVVYENLPEYTKSENLVFVQNGMAITIPIPQELAFVVDPFRQFTEGLYGSNKNSFWELAANDILGAFPVDFTGFTTVDMDDLVADPTIFDRLQRGAARVFSQVAPIPIKSAYMLATGTDPYSGKKLRDSSWVVWNDEIGDYETMDYNQSSFTKLIAGCFGKDANTKIAEKVLSGIFGNTGMDVADTLVSTFQRFVLGDESADPFAGAESQIERIGSSLTGEDYSMLNSEWQRAIAQLESERDAIIASKEMQDLQTKLGQDNDEDTRQKLLAKRKDLLADWQKRVASTTQRLAEQGGTLDRYKFGAVVQLLNMNSVNGWAPENKYLQNLASQNYYAGRNEAYRTMDAFGLNGTNDYSIFGYIKYKDDQPTIVYNTPTSIVTAGNLLLSAKDVDKANIDAIIKKNDLYTQREEMYNQTNAIYNKKKLSKSDYNNIDAIKMAYNNRVLAALVPYLEKVSPEAITNNEQIMDVLENLIQVPSAYEKIGKKYVSSGGGKLNKQQGFVRSYIKAILNKDNM